MNTSEFKKIARILREVYAEIKQEILDAGIDLFSSEYDTLFKKAQDSARELILEKFGYTIEQYREAKALVEANKQKLPEALHKTVEDMHQSFQNLHIPSTEEIKSIAEQVVKPPTIINQIVKETIIEKPTVSHETIVEEYDATEIKADLARALQQLDEIRVPEQVDIEKLKEELHSDFSALFEKNIDVLGMPNFRKLAMGLQGQIDEVRSIASQPSSSVSLVEVNGTIDGSNDTFTLPSTPTTGILMLVLARQPQIEDVDYTFSGTTITYTTPPAEDLSGQPHIAILY